MESSEKDKEDSEGEIHDNSLKPDSPKSNKSTESKKESKPEVVKNRIQYSSDEDMEIVVLNAKPPPVVEVDDSSDDDMAKVVIRKDKKSPSKTPKKDPEMKSPDTDEEIERLLKPFESNNIDKSKNSLDCSTDEDLDLAVKAKLNGSTKSPGDEDLENTQILDPQKKVLDDKLIYLNDDLSAIDKIKLTKNVEFLKGYF